MKKIAIVGLEKNDSSDLFNNIQQFKKKYDIELISFFYKDKFQDLYDELEEKGYEPADFIAAISIGGDGTFLYTSRVFAGTDVAIFGINKGRLGFNTNIDENEFNVFFKGFLDGKVEFEYKTLLDINIENHPTYVVLNEGVISHTGISRMIRLKVFLEDHPLCNFRGDGLIISSPTGSTAYNLSAGGPILHPQVDAFVVCPICPHTLAIRPLIIPFDEQINVIVEESQSQPQITLDGHKVVLLNIGERIVFKKSNKKVKIIKGNKNFTEILEEKLGWMVYR